MFITFETENNEQITIDVTPVQSWDKESLVRYSADQLGCDYYAEYVVENANNVVTLFEHKLKKGDIIGAIEQSIAESNQSDTLAKEAISVINNKQQFIDKLVETTLLKYPIL